MIHFTKVTKRLSAWYRSGAMAELSFALALGGVVGNVFTIVAMGAR